MYKEYLVLYFIIIHFKIIFTLIFTLFHGRGRGECARGGAAGAASTPRVHERGRGLII